MFNSVRYKNTVFWMLRQRFQQTLQNKFSMSSQSLSLSVASHRWSGVILALQFKLLDFLAGIGVKTNDAGEGGVERTRGTPELLRRFILASFC